MFNRSWTKHKSKIHNEEDILALARSILEKATALSEMDDMEARLALEREPELVKAVADAEAERDDAFMQVRALKEELDRSSKHLEKVRAELKRTQEELQRVNKVLETIGAQIERGTTKT